MAQEVHSFWTEIKKYEDILVKDPNSFCFAQLSELYRKLGLLDDAIFVAKRGVENHPHYVGGHLALGRAYFDKGLKASSREELEQVVGMTPENYIAQRLLSQIYLEQNDTALAEATLLQVLELNPDDVESRLSLEALARNVAATDSEQLSDDEDDIEEAEIVEDDDLLLEEFSVEGFTEPVFGTHAVEPEAPSLADFPAWEESAAPDFSAAAVPDEPVADEPVADEPELSDFAEPAGEPSRDPLSTTTLAEIYLAQGFYDHALKIYRELLAESPDNEEFRKRILDIEERMTSATAAEESFADLPDAPVQAGPAETTALDPDTESTLAALDEWLGNIEKKRNDAD